MSSIIDSGNYTPEHGSAQDDAQAGSYSPLTVIDMHDTHGGTNAAERLDDARQNGMDGDGLTRILR